MFVIYDFMNKKFVCRRRNVSYELFTDYLHLAKFYKTRSHAESFARAIMRVRNNPYDFRVIEVPEYSF